MVGLYVVYFLDTESTPVPVCCIYVLFLMLLHIMIAVLSQEFEVWHAQ